LVNRVLSAIAVDEQDSSLRQIDVGNVEQLKPVWTFRMGKPGSEAVPIVVEGVMYATGPDGVYALVPETGELLWKYDAAPVAPPGSGVLAGSGQLASARFHR
jgi:glucose dehydrogenase